MASIPRHLLLNWQNFVNRKRARVEAEFGDERDQEGAQDDAHKICVTNDVKDRSKSRSRGRVEFGSSKPARGANCKCTDHESDEQCDKLGCGNFSKSARCKRVAYRVGRRSDELDCERVIQGKDGSCKAYKGDQRCNEQPGYGKPSSLQSGK